MNGSNGIFVSPVFMIILICLMIVFITGISILIIMYKKLNQRYLDFMGKLGEGNKIEKVLIEYLNMVKETSEKRNNHEEKWKGLENNMKKCVQKVGLIRYNAYGDTGSDLSFTMALMDADENGVVVNGLYSRESSSIFAKPLVKGDTKYNLSAEEIQAIDIARTSSNSRY